MIPLSWYLYLSAGLFGIGLYGVLARKNAIAILMGVELMLNAVNINIVAFWRYLTPQNMSGQAFAVMVFAGHFHLPPPQDGGRQRDQLDEVVAAT